MNPNANPFEPLASTSHSNSNNEKDSKNDESHTKSPSKRKLSVSSANAAQNEFQLSKDEKRKQLKLAKRERKRLMQQAQLQLQSASLEKRGNLIKVKDFQNVILHLMADGPCPSWLHFQAAQGIDRILCIDIHNCPRELLIQLANNDGNGDAAHVPVDLPAPVPKLFHDNPETVPVFHESELDLKKNSGKTQIHQVPVVDWIGLNVLGPGDKYKSGFAWDEWTQAPLTQRQKAEMRQRLESQKCNAFVDLLMTEEQLEHEKYPMGSDVTDGFIELPAKRPDGKHFPIVAIDCEMCWTALGLEVTRVSVVNDQLHVVYDEFVKPSSPILDYNTQYSGITEELLRNVKKTLADCQDDLKKLLDRDTIIVGQSLENDFRVLKLSHRRVIDTAIIFHSSRGPPSKPSLRYLAQRHLNREIQGSSDGHDSIEDAKTCMELARLKLQNGFAFGLVLKESESLFSRIARSGKQSCVVSRSHAQTEDVEWLRVTDAQELVEKTLQKLGEKHLVMTQLHLRNPRDPIPTGDCEEVIAPDDPETIKTDLIEETASAQQKHEPVQHPDAHPHPPSTSTSPNKKPEYQPETLPKSAQLHNVLSHILPQIPPRTLVMLLAFHRHPDTQRLFKERGEYMRLVAQYGAKHVHETYPDLVFNEEKLAQLELGTRRARTGFGLLKMK